MNTRIIHTDATPEAELDALASVYRFIVGCHAKRRAVESTPEPDSPDDVRKDLGCSHRHQES